jgi:hypothetical protein
VVLQAGVNDLKVIAQAPARRPTITSECEANLTRLVELCRSTGATVVLTTVFSIGHVPLWRRPFWSNEVDVAVREVNGFLASLTGERVVVFDAGRVLDGQDGHVKAAYEFDYLHLLPVGYAALDEKVVPLLLPPLLDGGGGGQVQR